MSMHFANLGKCLCPRKGGASLKDVAKSQYKLDLNYMYMKSLVCRQHRFCVQSPFRVLPLELIQAHVCFNLKLSIILCFLFEAFLRNSDSQR